MAPWCCQWLTDCKTCIVDQPLLSLSWELGVGDQPSPCVRPNYPCSASSPDSACFSLPVMRLLCVSSASLGVEQRGGVWLFCYSTPRGAERTSLFLTAGLSPFTAVSCSFCCVVFTLLSVSIFPPLTSFVHPFTARSSVYLSLHCPLSSSLNVMRVSGDSLCCLLSG